MGAIGSFVIGESAVGNAPFDWRATLLAQYANSPTMLALMESMSESIDPTTDLDNFYDAVWNVNTAIGFGLDIWGRIVGVGRVYPVADTNFFGYEEAVDFYGFNQEPFYTGNINSSNFSLADGPYRQLILAKAASNITDGSIPSINNILKLMFPGRGNCYVVDNADMTMTYKFDFVLSPVELTIVSTSGVLPHPTGVHVNVVHL